MFIWIAIVVGSVLLDQLIKYLTVMYLKPVGTVPLIEKVLHLTYVENTGAAFGMLKDSRWVFMAVSTLAIIGVTVYVFVRKPTNKWERVSLALIVGGGIGNMIDRVLLGYVVDMIDFRLINFAVFNFADMCVCVGAGLMVLTLMISIIRESRRDRAAAGIHMTVKTPEEIAEDMPEEIAEDMPEAISKGETDADESDRDDAAEDVPAEANDEETGHA